MTPERPRSDITRTGASRFRCVRARVRAQAARTRMRAEDGFMVMEALVAAVILAVGLLSTFVVLDVSAKTSMLNKARNGGVALARELTEDARSIPYSQISPSTIVSQLQALPSMANVGSGSTWQVIRAGITYTITASDCSIDDGADGYGTHDGTFCSDSTTTGTSDTNPYDLKRVTVNVSWTVRGTNHSVTEMALITGAGEATGLQTSALQVADTPATLTGSKSPTVTSLSITGMDFTVTAPTTATNIVWTLNGAKQTCGFNSSASCWTATHSGTQWTSSVWGLSGLADGTYVVGAAAEDGNGIIGPAVTIPVTLTRNIPTAPVMSDWGYNANFMVGGHATTVTEMDWQPNPQPNVNGYRIYNPSGTLICSTTNATSYASCGTNAWCMTPSSCVDFNPPASTAANLTYQVAATYLDVNGVTQEGPRTSFVMTGTSGNKYTLAATATNTGSNCSGGSILQDMLGTYTAATDTTQTANKPVFCSDPFSAGATIEGGGTATAYYANSGASACTVTATLTTNGNSQSESNTATATIPAGRTTPTATTFTFTNNTVLSMDTGSRLNLQFDATAGGCSSTALHYAGSTYPSAFTTATMSIYAPNTPASLTVTPQSDGTATLTWPISSGGAEVSFYRVYRDGPNYTNRYTVVPTSDCISGTCSYTDTKRTSSHSYYVTGVGSTAQGADLAESAEVGPATG